MRELIRYYGWGRILLAACQTIVAAFVIWALLVMLFAVQAAELVIPGEAPDNLEGRYIYRAPLDDLQAWEWVGFTAGTDNRWTLPDDYNDFCWKYANVTRELPGNWTEELSPTDAGCQKRAGCHR
jgi:hypothetical protein